MVIMQQLPEITVASLTTEHPTDGSWFIPAWKLICLISRSAGYVIRSSGGVGGLLSDGESYPDRPYVHHHEVEM